MTVTVAPAKPDASRTMTAREWVVMNLSILAVVVLLNLLLAWKVDLFGLLRDPRGRAIHTSRHERKAKYLLNFKYVPDNFDALVVGASSSLNWNLDELTGYRFYNESLLGADGVEENLYVEKALERGHFKVALVGIGRGLTDRSDLQDGLDQATTREALGSFYSYVMMLDRVTHPHSQYGANGCWQIALKKPDPIDYVTPYPVHRIDDKSLNDYRQLVEDLMAHGTRVVYFINPHYGLGAPGAREVLAQAHRNILEALPPGPVIDFNADEYAWLHDNPDDFIDEDHLSPTGATIVTRIVNQKMHEFLGDR